MSTQNKINNNLHLLLFFRGRETLVFFINYIEARVVHVGNMHYSSLLSCEKTGDVLLVQDYLKIRELKSYVYLQKANVSSEFLRIENKHIKTVQNNSYG